MDRKAPSCPCSRPIICRLYRSGVKVKTKDAERCYHGPKALNIDQHDVSAKRRDPVSFVHFDGNGRRGLTRVERKFLFQRNYCMARYGRLYLLMTGSMQLFARQNVSMHRHNGYGPPVFWPFAPKRMNSRLASAITNLDDKTHNIRLKYVLSIAEVNGIKCTRPKSL